MNKANMTKIEKWNTVQLALRQTMLASLPWLLTISCCVNAAPAPPKEQHPKTLSPAQAKQQFDQVISHYPIRYANEFPTNFPVPSYTTNVIKTNFFHSTKGAPTAGGVIVTKDPPQTVFDWYKHYCDGNKWAVKTPNPRVFQQRENAPKLLYMEATDQHQKLSIIILPTPHNPSTTVRIAWEKIK